MEEGTWLAVFVVSTNSFGGRGTGLLSKGPSPSALRIYTFRERSGNLVINQSIEPWTRRSWLPRADEKCGIEALETLPEWGVR